MTEAPLRVLLLSDLHAYSPPPPPGTSAPSFLRTDAPEDQAGEHPFADLLRLVEQQAIAADLVVCCGDIGDKAQPQAIAWAWQWLKRITTSVGARRLIVTSGNHDVDSRYVYNDHDARGTLLGLGGYPFDDEVLCNEYWARGAVLLNEPDCNLAVLNSANYHGVNDEWKHGRVTRRTVEYLRGLFVRLDPTLPNILVCHHHLYKFGTVDLADYSEMSGASVLLDLLGSGEYGRWLVLHGHRHWPNLEYASGSGTSPTVFAAGSFAAVLYDELQDKARNQIYELSVEKSVGGSRGTFRAWDWTSGLGFGPAQPKSGLPHLGGFGNRRGGDAVADNIEALLGEPGETLSWHQLQARVPDLAYLTPRDRDLCVRLLESRGLEVLDRRGNPAYVGRPVP